MYRYIRSDQETNDMMNNMIEIADEQDKPKVGPFWYDPIKDELFGAYPVIADDVKPYKSEYGEETRTGSRLHEQIWKKEVYRNKDRRFSGDYTQVPRGRVFKVGDKYVVMTGDWIDTYPSAKEQIIFEFDLPEDAEFRKDIHWDIGHGWSDMKL